MNLARRINRIQEPSINVKIRSALTVSDFTLWRGDHFLYSASSGLDGSVTQRYHVLDFGLEERAAPVLIPNPNPERVGAPPLVPQLDDAGDSVIQWIPTGLIQIQMQRVTDTGMGLSNPTTKMIVPPNGPDEIDMGWHGWIHVPDSPRRPERDDLDTFIAEQSEADPRFAEELANAMIASWREQGAHVGLSLNFGDRRCYVCDEDWPCQLATDYDATADVPE